MPNQDSHRCAKLDLSFLLMASLAFALAGCQAVTGPVAQHPAAASAALQGSIHGGQQPVSGAQIQLYAVGDQGNGSAATSLLPSVVTTTSNGYFSLPTFTCPAADPIVYLTASGGNPGLASGTSNHALSLMALLGRCSSLNSIASVSINEITTMASVWALAPYMTSMTNVGSAASDPGMANAPMLASQLANLTSGLLPGVDVPAGYAVQTARLDALADILGTCVNSSGGVAGDGTRCGTLFALSQWPGTAAPVDTVGAALMIAEHPTTGVAELFGLLPAQTVFSPSLDTSPTDWSLALVPLPAAPAYSPAAGTYLPGQVVSITSPALASALYYTVDGSIPSVASNLYRQPISLTGQEVIKAISVVNAVNSPVTSGAYSTTSAQLVFSMLPQSIFVGGMLNPAPTVSLVDVFGKALPNQSCSVTLTLRNATAGTLSGGTTITSVGGTATFSGVLINQPGSYSLGAACDGLMPITSPPFTVTPPPLSISLPTSTVDVGSSLVGTVSLAIPPIAPVTIALNSSVAGHVVVPSVVVVAAGQTSATFSYTGVVAGSSSLLAAAPGYASATAQLNAIAVAPPTTLRQAAASRGLLVGAAADADEYGYIDPLTTYPLYAATLGTQYNILEAESAMKWIVQRPTQNAFNFEPGDQLVAFAQAHQMKVRGHNLVWGVANPDWLNTYASTATPAQMAETLQTHIQTVVDHYRGQVFAWDVVNEAVDDNATGVGTQMKDSIWYDQPGIGLPGTGYVEQAFRWAHAADPNALLFYNDYNIYVPGPKFQAVLNMVRDFLSRGVPINGVGFQMHLGTNGWPDSASLAANMRAITALGLQVHITEMDVEVPVGAAGVASPGDLQTQAATYQRILTVCLENPGCTAFQTWGFSDAYSWVPGSNPGFGAALPFDLNYQPKPAFYSVLNTLIQP